MAIYLDEDQLGSDQEIIGFPHILLCMGFVYVTSTKIYGIHLTNTKDTDRVITVFNKWLNEEGAKQSQATAIYGSANLQLRYKNAQSKSDLCWKKELTKIAEILGYTGNVYGFDTSIIYPRDGTYIEYQVNNSKKGECNIYYKRNEKMNYGDYSHSDNIFKITRKNTLRKDKGVKSITSAKVKRTWFSKGLLHQVDFERRLMKFKI